MKDKKHFLDHHHHHHHHHDTTAASSPSSSSPPLYPSLHHPAPPFSTVPTPTTDGATVELPRRRRGRPPGSKNKPKPPPAVVSPTRAAQSPSDPYALHPSMRTLLLQIEPENDVVESISRFCRKKSISLSLLSASGTLSHFTLRHPTSPPSTLTFRGRFDILTISATVVSEGTGSGSNNTAPASSFYLPSGFTVTVSGPQGQVVGGAVGGPLVAAGPVFVVAASFEKPTYHRLPEVEEDEGGEEKGEASEVAAVGGGGGGGGGFGGNLGGSEVVWAPVAARPPY